MLSPRTEMPGNHREPYETRAAACVRPALRRTVAVDYVTRIDDLLALAREPGPAAGDEVVVGKPAAGHLSFGGTTPGAGRSETMRKGVPSRSCGQRGPAAPNPAPAPTRLRSPVRRGLRNGRKNRIHSAGDASVLRDDYRRCGAKSTGTVPLRQCSTHSV